MARPTTAEASATPSTAFAQERHQRILQLLSERGRVRNAEMAELLNVTEATIRKDMSDLAKQQRLQRTHGGAITLRTLLEPDLSARVSTNAESKKLIATACLNLIRPGDAVFLDSGSTVLCIAELLGKRSIQDDRLLNINVLTNALAVAQTLVDQPGIRHTVLGGVFRPTGGCFVGPLTVNDLNTFTVNTAFVGVTGLTEQGFTVADLGEAQVKQAVIDRARRVVVPMDHSKLGAADFARVCELDAVTTIVTDHGSTYLDGLCSAAGVELIVADPG